MSQAVIIDDSGTSNGVGIFGRQRTLVHGSTW